MSIILTGETGIEAPDFLRDGVSVVESGSNGNGHWVRFFDGTQLCFKGVDVSSSTGILRGSLYEYDVDIGAFPAAFDVVFWIGAYPGGGNPIQFRSRSWAGKIGFARSTVSLSTTGWDSFSWYSQNSYTVSDGNIYAAAFGTW